MKTAVRMLFLAAPLLTAPSAMAPGLSHAAAGHDAALVRVPPAAEGATIELAQPVGPPDAAGGGAFMPRLAGAFFGWRMAAPLPPRQACLERIDRHVGIAAYIKSKLQLRPEQKEAWRKIEAAAEPALQTLREVCGELPDRPDARPTLPDLIDIADKAVTARAALLHAIREPVRQLYEELSPDQRAALVVPMMHPGGL
jgi:hypothetical protein